MLRRTTRDGRSAPAGDKPSEEAHVRLCPGRSVGSTILMGSFQQKVLGRTEKQ